MCKVAVGCWGSEGKLGGSEGKLGSTDSWGRPGWPIWGLCWPMQWHKFSLQRKSSFNYFILLLVWLSVRVLPPLYNPIHYYPAVTLGVVYSVWFALLKEEGCCQVLFLFFWYLQPLQSSPSQSWNLISLTTAGHFPACLPLQGAGEFLCYSALTLWLIWWRDRDMWAISLFRDRDLVSESLWISSMVLD